MRGTAFKSARAWAAGLAACTCAATGRAAPVELFNNGRAGLGATGLATGGVSASGVAAPAGWQWSETAAQTGQANALAGISVYAGSAQGGLRVADNFVVPSGQTWTLDRVRTYVYGRGTSGTPVSALMVRIWDGPPGHAASRIVYGDAANRLSAATALNLYRIFATQSIPLPQPPGTTRPIWQVEASLAGATLNPGEYWLDVQTLAAAPGGQVFIPPVTTPGVRLVPGANAVQLVPGPADAEPTWGEIIDLGKPGSAPDVALELPFALFGTAGTAATCALDYNRDGFMNLDDLGDFLTDSEATPVIPGGLQPAAPSLNDRVVGYGVPCPAAANAPAPYAANAYRTYGYRIAFTAEGTNPCPEGGPNLDNIGDFLTAFWTTACN